MGFAHESRVAIVIVRKAGANRIILFAIVRHRRILEVSVLVLAFLEPLLTPVMVLFALNRFLALDA